MKKIIDWLIFSSVNPAKISLTLKSIAPFVLALAALLRLDITAGDWDQAIEAVVAIASAVVLLYGLGRKIVLSIRK